MKTTEIAYQQVKRITESMLIILSDREIYKKSISILTELEADEAVYETNKKMYSLVNSALIKLGTT